jgi:hypothetical protein
MRYVPTRVAIELTGLTRPTLREWTSRRALIPADVPPKRQGSSAQYSWQTILLLRLAVMMRDHFHLELQAHIPLFHCLRSALLGMSFIALWGRSLALQGGECWTLIDDDAPGQLRGDAIIISLQPHLLILSAGFALPDPAAALGQLELFPAVAVADPADERRVVSPVPRTTSRFRRSA